MIIQETEFSTLMKITTFSRKYVPMKIHMYGQNLTNKKLALHIDLFGTETSSNEMMGSLASIHQSTVSPTPSHSFSVSVLC